VSPGGSLASSAAESPARAIALALVVAAVSVVSIGVLAGVSFGRISLLVALAGAGATVVNVAGAGIGAKLQHRTLALQIAVVSTTAVAATAGGTLLTALVGVASESATHTLLLALVASATAALVEAFVLAVRVSDVARSSPVDPTKTGAPPDLAEVSHDELASWLAADLHQPVRAMAEVVRSLERGAAADPVSAARHHAAIHHESERLVRLVDDLYELGRGPAGALGVRMDHIALPELVADAVAAAGEDATRAQVRIETMLEGGGSPLRAPLPAVARVVRALLDDAISHSLPGTLVEVETATDGNDAVLSVRDSCGGISDGDSARVFDVAFRAAADDVVLAMDEGHDLASARRLVQLHHGVLVVERLGDGCRFTVRLPLAS
jgi:signal transduction histidine kinase